MKLSIKDRIKLSELVKDQAGSFSTLKIIRKLLESLSLTEEEIKETQFKEIPAGDGRVQMAWILEKDPMREYDFGELSLKIISDKLRRLSDTDQLTSDQFDLYEKFIEETK